MLGRLKHAMMLMAIVLSIASPALAHTPPPTFVDDLELRYVEAIDEHEIAEPLPIIPASTFDEVARIELPSPSIVETLEQRTDAMLAHDDARTHRLFALDSAEVASWPRASGDENNINGERKLSLELHRATEFQALPFSEPATGLVYARARWYDPSTGSFLTADPLGYQDSSNLYAFCGGDPVNCKDPTGTEAARTAKGGVYITNPKNGARYLISKTDAEADPVALQDMLMIEGGLSRQQAKDFLQEMGLRYTHPYERRVVRPDLPNGDGWVKNIIVATSGLPPQNRQQQIAQGVLQIAGSVGMVRATKANAGTMAVGPVVRLSDGRVSAAIPVSVADARGWMVPESPTSQIRQGVQGSYIDPLTNTKVITGQRLSADHSIPQSYIKKMRGFDRLSPEAQEAVLNFDWNIAGLLGPMNSSKNNRLPADWKAFKGQPLDPNYIAANRQLQPILIRLIQAEIDRRLGQ